MRQYSRVTTQTQSLTSTKKSGKQLVEIELAQLEDEHDLDFEEHVTARLTGYPETPLR